MYISRSHDHSTIFDGIFRHEILERCIKWCWCLLSVSWRHAVPTLLNALEFFLFVQKKRQQSDQSPNDSVIVSEVDSYSKYRDVESEVDSYRKFRDVESEVDSYSKYKDVESEVD